MMPFVPGSVGRAGGASAVGAYEGVRGVASKSSGKWYFRGAFGAIANATSGLGVGNSAALLASYVGTNQNSAGYLADGRLLYNNQNQGSYASLAAGDNVDIALDVDAGLLWVGKNGAWQNGTPGVSGGLSVGTGKVWFPMLTVYGVTNLTLGADLSALPGGFSPWS